MLNINRVMFTGRLTREPETKYLQNGTAVTKLSVAVNRPYRDTTTNEWKEEVSFIDVDVWGKAAERIAETGRKGQPVYVEGRLKQDTWERDGQKQSKLKVSADTVKSFDVPQRGQQGADPGEYEDSYQSSPAQQSRPQAQAQGSGGGSASGKPSDGLHFDGGSNVNDDVPF